MISPEELKRYYDLMVTQDLWELEIREKDFYLRLARQKPQVYAAAPLPVSAPTAAPVETKSDDVSVPEEQNQFRSIASPLAGIFYRASSPQSQPFVKEGDKVAFGDVLCIVEAMKVMNEIRADRPCVIRKISAENGKPVAPGQILFVVDPVS